MPACFGQLDLLFLQINRKVLVVTRLASDLVSPVEDDRLFASGGPAGGADNQRRSCFIDQDTIRFIDDGIIKIALCARIARLWNLSVLAIRFPSPPKRQSARLALAAYLEAIAQKIKAKFGCHPIGNILPVRLKSAIIFHF